MPGSARSAARSGAIDALIDPTFADLRATFRHELTVTYGLPATVSPVAVIGAIRPRPILIIRGTADTSVPVDDPAGYRARVIAFFAAALR